MILLVHMLFGAAIGATVKNPTLGVILALLGHYFLDLFPHIEYLDGVESSIKNLKKNRWQKNISDVAKVLLDFCLGLLVIFLVSKNSPIVYLCAFVAIIPDGLTVIHALFPHMGLATHHYLHGNKIHFLKHKKIPKFWRVATQLITVAVSLVLLRL